MKLRFAVDQAECFRKGVDCPKSVVTVEVDPAKTSQQERDRIADRLTGIDVRKLRPDGLNLATLIEAKSPDYAGLIAAVRADEEEVEAAKRLAAYPGSIEELL